MKKEIKFPAKTEFMRVQYLKDKNIFVVDWLDKNGKHHFILTDVISEAIEP